MKAIQSFNRLIIVVLILSTVTATIPKHGKAKWSKLFRLKNEILDKSIQVQDLSRDDSNRKPSGASTRDWLSDIISQLLGISVSDLLKLINTTLQGMDELVEAAVLQLEKIIESVNPEAQEELKNVINIALSDILEIMAPILEQMGEVLPAITREAQPRDLVSDIILAILGITLEELLQTVTEALANLNIILNQTLQALHEVAEEVNPEASQEIRSVSDFLVDDAKQLLSPLLDMLRQIFPEKVSGCFLTSELRKEFSFRNSINCQQL